MPLNSVESNAVQTMSKKETHCRDTQPFDIFYVLFLNLCDLSFVTLTYLLLFVRRGHERYFDNLYYFCYYFK